MSEDIKILKRLKEGDPDAFDLIFERYYRKVYTFCLITFRNKEDAEETVQDIFCNLWKDREKLFELKDLEAWIFSVCFNIIRKHFRNLFLEKKHLKAFKERYSDCDSSTIAEIEYRDLLEKTDRLIKKLPPRQKTIFILSRKESMSNLEISEKLNISVRTVDNQLSRAKSFLKKALVHDNLLFSLLLFIFSLTIS